MICYCSTVEHSVIPAPVSSEDKAKQYEEDLILDADDTSTAVRKLSCAEDRRPSAVSVG